MGFYSPQNVTNRKISCLKAPQKMSEVGSLAPIVVVMPVVAWVYEALERHLNGKRGACF